MDTLLLSLANLVDLVNVQHASLGCLQIEVGGVEQLQQQVLNILTHIAGFGERRRITDGKGHVEHSCQRAGAKSVLPDPVGPINRMLDFSISTPELSQSMDNRL